jgi:hypothetical protein
MLASNRIEALAFAGKCRWQMFWTGYTSAYTIPVPRGGFVLMRQIIYSPFYQGATKAAQALNTIHQVSVVEQGSRNELLYIFRDTLNEVTGSGAATHFTPGSGQQVLETWATYKKNVCIDVLNAPDAGGASYGLATSLSSEAQERVQPLGYGGVNILPFVNITAAEKYYPTGEQRLFNGAAYTGAGIRDRLRYDFGAARQISAVNATDFDRQFQFPLIGFGCWVFNIPIDEYLNSGN